MMKVVYTTDLMESYFILIQYTLCSLNTGIKLIIQDFIKNLFMFII